MPADKAPTVRRRRLGAELRRLRTAAGLGINDVAAHLECDPSKISRIENGRTGIRPMDLRAVLRLCGVDDEGIIDQMVKVSRESRLQGWWTQYSDSLNKSFADFVALEDSASSIRSYETTFVPGLLQTADYSRVLVHATNPMLDTEQVERLLRIRAERQALLERSGFHFWAVIGEAALRHSVGSPGIRKRQFHALADLAVRPNIDIQILPLDSSIYPVMTGSFNLLSFAAGDQDVAYQDVANGTVFAEAEEEVARYVYAFDQLRAAATPPLESAALFDEIAKDL